MAYDPATVTGPISAISENLPSFVGETGRILQDSGYSVASILAAVDVKISDVLYHADIGRTIGKVIAYENYDGLPAILIDDRLLISKPTTTSNDYANVHIARDANFVGGTSGAVNGALVVSTTVRDGVTSFEWGLQALMNNYATGGQNTAAYSLMHAMEGASHSWAHVHELDDHSFEPSTARVSSEFNINANGGDPHSVRRVINVGLWQFDKDGDAVVADRAVSVGTAPTGAIFLNGYYCDGAVQVPFKANGSHTVGLDLSTATFTEAAIRIGANQTIALEGTGAITLRYHPETSKVQIRNGAIVLAEW